MSKVSGYYLSCQVLGWGFLWVVFFLAFPSKDTRLLWIVIVGLLASHGLREAILRSGWLKLSYRMGLTRVFIATAATAFAAGLVRWIVFRLIYGTYSQRSLIILLDAVVDYFALLVSWVCIYCICHYVRNERRAVGYTMKG